MRKTIAVLLLLWPLAGCGNTPSTPLSPTAQKVEALLTQTESRTVWDTCRAAPEFEKCLREHAGEIAIAENKDEVCFLWDAPELCLDAFNYHAALTHKDVSRCARLNNNQNRQECLKALDASQIDAAAMSSSN